MDFLKKKKKKNGGGTHPTCLVPVCAGLAWVEVCSPRTRFPATVPGGLYKSAMNACGHCRTSHFPEQETKAWEATGPTHSGSTKWGVEKKCGYFGSLGACLLDKRESCCVPDVTGRGHIFRGSHSLENDPKVLSFPQEPSLHPTPSYSVQGDSVFCHLVVSNAFFFLSSSSSLMGNDLGGSYSVLGIQHLV